MRVRARPRCRAASTTSTREIASCSSMLRTRHSSCGRGGTRLAHSSRRRRPSRSGCSMRSRTCASPHSPRGASPPPSGSLSGGTPPHPLTEATQHACAHHGALFPSAQVRLRTWGQPRRGGGERAAGIGPRGGCPRRGAAAECDEAHHRAHQGACAARGSARTRGEAGVRLARCLGRAPALHARAHHGAPLPHR